MSKIIAAPRITVRAKDGTRFVMLNDAFSSGRYTVLRQTMARVLHSLFIEKHDSYNVQGIGYGTFGNGTYPARTNGTYPARTMDEGEFAIGCKIFTKNDAHKIAKWTKAFSKTTMDRYFPTVIKAKAARGR